MLLCKLQPYFLKNKPLRGFWLSSAAEICIISSKLRHMFNTLSLNEAIELAPSIGALSPSSSVSKKYQFVSTKDILEQIHENGWRITNVSAQNRSIYSQHRVTLMHTDNINTSAQTEGVPRIEMFNSHNKTKRLMFAIGYFRFVCSNGLIVAAGPNETIRTKHRFSDSHLNSILERVSEISDRFPKILQKINDFKNRTLTEEEQILFARYAISGRYNYRSELPKRINLNRDIEKILQPRRVEDSGNSTWEIYNRIQENIISGIKGYTRPVNGYSDNIRVNQLLWKGAETTLCYKNENLKSEFVNLLAKDGKKGKISA